MKLRGYAALALVCLGLLIADPVQRFVIAPLARLRPASRIRILTRWMRANAWLVTRPLEVLGGARIPSPPPVVPAEPGVLILMNHQSLFDIPLIIQAVEGGYPRIITRARYGRGIPLISHMTRLYQYPLVDPSANPGALRRTYRELREVARTSTVPIAMFPEGSRTRDGRIRPFRRKGLELMLRARPWRVYVLVVDGYWRWPRFKDFMRGISGIRGRIELAGELEWTDPRGDTDAFADEVRAMMVERLEAMRSGAGVA